MTPNITVKYFDIRGRAEPMRLAFLLGDVPFTDERIKFDEWKEMKATTPFGSLPLLVVDGETFAQSNACLRYAGKLSGLYPVDDPVKALKMDMIIDTVVDMGSALFAYRGPDKEQLKAAREKALAESVPRYWGALEKIVAGFSDGPFVLGEKVSIADLAICETINNVKQGMLDFFSADSLDKYKRLIGVHTAVLDIPSVKEWYKKYPIPNVTT